MDPDAEGQVPVPDAADARGPTTRANNMEVVHFSQSQPGFPVHFSQLSQSQPPFAVRPDALSAAVIEQTVNALPLQPESISDVKGPMLKLKRVDSRSVDVKVIHSFTAHYPTRLTSRRVIEHADPLQLDSQSTDTPALLDRPSQRDDGPVGQPARGLAPAWAMSPRSLEHQEQEEQQQQEDVDMGVDCEPVVVECEEAEAALLPCNCPGQGVWELDASHIQMGKRIGVGGFSEVFVAKYEGTLVAVKRLLNTGAETARQLCTEVALLAQLRHPNLLLFMGYTTRPELCIVSEFMARGSLYNILRAQQRSGRPLEPRLQRVVAISVARGMLYLHTRNPPILHLDLKSPNILVDDRWRIKIADFGLSKARARTFVSTSMGSGAGTPEWMAPEMLRCEPLDDRADVYSYGVVLWELLTGDAPWEQLNPMQVVGAVGFAGKRLPAPASGDPCLLALCSACLSSLPASRPCFQQIVEALENHFAANPLSGGGSGSVGAPSPLGLGAASPAALQEAPAPPLLPAASAPPSTPSPHPAAPAPHGHLQHALTIATPAERPSPSRQSITPLGRRRERSPDSVDESPPAITTRLANGAKHPSPRLPTPTDPTFLQPNTPLAPVATDPHPPRATDSPRARLSPAHTHSGHGPTASLPAVQHPSFGSLPTPLPAVAPTPPPAPAPYVSPFAQNAAAPWASQSQSQRDLPPLDPSQPQSQGPAPADDPAFIAPFAALAAQITKNLAAHPLPAASDEDGVHDIDFDIPAPQLSPFAAFASAPLADEPTNPPRGTPTAAVPSAAAAAGPSPAAVSPVRSWLLTAVPAASPAEAAASTNTDTDGAMTDDDPMQADQDDDHPHDLGDAAGLHAAGPSPQPHSSPSSVGLPEGRASTHGHPLCPLLPEAQGDDCEAIMADSDADASALADGGPADAAAPGGPHAGSRCASPSHGGSSSSGGSAGPPAPPGGMVTPFFTHQLANSAAFQEVMQQAAPVLPRRVSGAIDIPRRTAADRSDAGAADDSGMPSLDEKTRLMLECAASSRCYNAGRFRVTSYKLKSEHLSLPNPPTICPPPDSPPPALAPAPTLGLGMGPAAVAALPPPPPQLLQAAGGSRECCVSVHDGEREDADPDVGLHGSCTMYKRGRFFIKSFCHKGGRAAAKHAVPKSIMLHTASSGLVATTSATALHADATSSLGPLPSSPLSACGGGGGGLGGGSCGGAFTSVNSLRRTVSISYGEIAAAVVPLPHRSSDDDLYDQHSPTKSPRQPAAVVAAAVAAPPAPAPLVLPLLSLPPRGSLSPSNSATVAVGAAVPAAAAAAATDDTLNLPARDSLGSQAATPRDTPPVFECRHYHRGRFDVREDIVVKPRSPPPAPAPAPQPSPPAAAAPAPSHHTGGSAATPAPSPRGSAPAPPAPSPRGGHRAPAPSPRGTGSSAGVAIKPGSRFTVVEHSSSSSSSRPASSKPKASPRAGGAAAQDTATGAAPAVPKLMGRFKVYEEAGCPRDPSARPRRSPRPGKAGSLASPRRSPNAAGSSHSTPATSPTGPARAAAAATPAAGAGVSATANVAGSSSCTALQLVTDALAQSITRVAAAAGGTASAETRSGSGSGGTASDLGGGVDCHVEVQCDGYGGQGYSIQVDVVMGGPGALGIGADDVMVEAGAADASSVGGGTEQASSGTDDVTVSPR